MSVEAGSGNRSWKAVFLRYWPTFSLWSLIAIGCLTIIFVGMISDVQLGDESFHYRLAQRIYNTGSRPSHDPLLHWTPFSRRPIITDVFWHYGLSAVWLISGGISRLAAQAYNAAYVLLLAIGTYLLGRKLYNRKIALTATLLMCGIPMVPTLSIIFHFDVAVTAIGTFTVLAILGKRYVLTGLLLGLTLLMKRNAYLLVPSVLLLLTWPEWKSLSQPKTGLIAWIIHNIRRWFLRSLVVLVLAAAVQVPDCYFRAKHFGIEFISPTYPPDALLQRIYMDPPVKEMSTEFYDVSSLAFNPSSALTFLGISLLGSLIIYLLYTRNKIADRFLLVACIAGIVTFVTMGPAIAWMVRYGLVLMPYLAIIAARGLVSLPQKARVLRWILLVGCVIQFAAASYWVTIQRRQSVGLSQAYKYIRKHTPEDAAFLAEQCAPIASYAHRRAQWRSTCCYIELATLCWNGGEQFMRKLTGRYGTTHFLIDQDRVFDDSQIKHLGGFPKSFVRKLHEWPSAQKIYDRDGVAIWKISPNEDNAFPPGVVPQAMIPPSVPVGTW